MGWSLWMTWALGACAVEPDDDEAETANGESASAPESEGEASNASTTEAAETHGSGDTSASGTGEETGDPTETTETAGEGPRIPFACADLECDAATEYCYEDIADAPSEFSCQPIPARCADDPSCECIVPIACPESLQDCQDADGAVTVECVTG